MKLRGNALIACLLAATLTLGGLAGCRKPDDGLTPQQQEKGSRLQEIAKRTGGDWNQLTPAERDFLVKELSYGNEQSARMLLLGAAGKIGGNKPGGPPGR